MDTSETYLTMCEKARKYLLKKKQWDDGELWEDGELYAYAINEEDCPFKYSDVRLVYCCENQPKPDAIPIYRQDQLQEILYGNAGVMLAYTLSKDIFNFAKSLGRKHIQRYQFHSMEQLWLAFVMRECYQKKWNGIDWEVDNGLR